MADRQKTYTEQLVVRVDGPLMDKLKSGMPSPTAWTVAQTVRFQLYKVVRAPA